MTVVTRHVAIVTGAAGGLGTAICRRLVADGLFVVAADLDVDRIDKGLALDTSVLTLRVDVTDLESVEAMAAEAIKRFGRIDVLVNSAGIAGPNAPASEYPVAAWRRGVEVNLVGAFLCARTCVREMVARGYGRVINISSIAGQDPNPGMSAYSASKAGVIALTKSIAKEVATTGVLVNCLVPGVISAGLTDRTPEAECEFFLSKVPMGRMGRPEEVAELASWMASPGCSFSTGATFDLSGGRAVY
jgi:2-dehydro-3-deoxy-L-rhamnonate dehydrogenase (NAD+)